MEMHMRRQQSRDENAVGESIWDLRGRWISVRNMEPGLLHEPLDFKGRVVYPFGLGMLELRYRHTEFGDEFYSSGGEL